jgi:hypothetical protein
VAVHKSVVWSFTFWSLGACAHQAPPSAVPAAPLPTLSVQRELEQAVGYRGEPGSMDFVELSAKTRAQGLALDEHTTGVGLRGEHTRER